VTVSTVIQEMSVVSLGAICIGSCGGEVVRPGKRFSIRFLVEVVLFQAGVPSRPFVKPKGVPLAVVRIFVSLLASGRVCISPVNFNQLSRLALRIILV
jgi:hypothetical protein